MRKKATVCFALVVMLLVSACAVTVLAGSASAQSTADAWSTFHHDLAHTGVSDSAAPRTNQTLWKFSTGSQMAPPVVADGVIYLGSYGRKVYAFSALNGTIMWTYTAGGVVLASVAVANGIVYAGSEDNKVYALNATTGEYIWSYSTGGGVASSPALADDVVYVGSYDGRLYALDASKGNLVWDYATGDMFVSSPAVVNGIVYVGSFDHVIYAFGASPNEQTNPTSFSVVLIFLLLAILVATAALAVWYLRRKH